MISCKVLLRCVIANDRLNLRVLEILSLFNNNKDIASVLHFSSVDLKQKYNKSVWIFIIVVSALRSILCGGDILGQRRIFGERLLLTLL